AAKVDRHNRPGTGSDRRLDLIRIDLRCLPVRVYEDRNCELEHDDIDGRDESIGRHDHLISRSDSERIQRSVERSGSAGSGNTALRSQYARPLCLKAVGIGTVEPAPALPTEDVAPGLLVVRGDPGPGRER